MLTWIKYTLAVIWLLLIVVVCVNLYYQYQVGRLQKKILNEYRLMSEIPEVFQTARDSVQLNIDRKLKQRYEAEKSFPLKDKSMNWLLLRISIGFMTIVNLVVVWIYYKRKTAEEKPDHAE